MPNAAEIVQRFKEAVGKGDAAGARLLLSDRLSFQGPFDTFDRPEPYLAALEKLHPIVKRVDVKKIFADGADVCLLYDLVTDSPAGTSFVAEWLRVEADRIASIRVVFDARPFAAMFGR
jgi:hypothetical protein